MTPTEAANQAAQVSGLPPAFTLALIQAEQGAPQLAITGNPFDVTQTWLNLAGLGGIVTGLWNSVGVAIVNDPSKAITGWWSGLSQFSNYKDFRAHLAQGASPTTLLNDLYKAGYAGSDPNWVTNVGNLYKQNSGLSPDAPLGTGVVVVPPVVTPPTGSPPVITTQPPPIDTTITTDNPLGLTLTKSSDPVFGGLIDSVNSFQAGVLAVVASVERFFWILIGLLIVALGVWVLVEGERNKVTEGA